jgi:hypothetical protein
MEMMCPYPPFFMCGRHALAIRNEPFELTSLMRAYLLRGVSRMSCHHSADALLIRMSMRPNVSTAARTHASTSASLRTSTLNGSARAPVPSRSTSSGTVKMVPGSVGCGWSLLAAITT